MAVDRSRASVGVGEFIGRASPAQRLWPAAVAYPSADRLRCVRWKLLWGGR